MDSFRASVIIFAKVEVYRYTAHQRLLPTQLLHLAMAFKSRIERVHGAVPVTILMMAVILQ